MDKGEDLEQALATAQYHTSGPVILEVTPMLTLTLTLTLARTLTLALALALTLTLTLTDAVLHLPRGRVQATDGVRTSACRLYISLMDIFLAPQLLSPLLFSFRSSDAFNIYFRGKGLGVDALQLFSEFESLTHGFTKHIMYFLS